ncbi:MAG: PAS domain S-box protein [Sediminibacterium sp.]|nr:PAS domain S-box protein [Sediminibacterium sp.]
MFSRKFILSLPWQIMILWCCWPNKVYGNTPDPFYQESWFWFFLIVALLVLTWLLLKYLKVFDFERFHTSGTENNLILKIRILVLSSFFLIAGVDLMQYALSNVYKVEWWSDGGLALLAIGLFLGTYSRRTSLKVLSLVLQSMYYLLVAVSFYQTFRSGFDPVFSVEVAIVVLFSIVVFPNTRSVFIFSSLAFVTSVLMVVLFPPVKETFGYLLISSVAQADVAVLLFYYLEKRQQTKTTFSEKLLKNTKQFVIVSDRNARIIYINDYMAETLGVREEELLGENWWYFRGWDEEKLKAVKVEMQELIASGRTETYTNTIEDKVRNKVYYIEWQDTPIDRELVMGIGKDVTQEVLNRLELDRKYNNTRLINEIGKEITSTLSIASIISRSYENVKRIFDSEVFAIGIYQEATNSLVFEGVIERGEQLKVYHHYLDETQRLSVNCFIHQTEFLSGNCDKDFAQEAFAPENGEAAVSLIYLPLTINNKRIGVITVQSFSKEAFNAYHFQQFKSLALYVAIALDNASLYKDMERQVAERTSVIRKAYENTKLLGEIAKDISKALTIRALNENVYANVNELMDAYAFGIGIYNPDEAKLVWDGFIENNHTNRIFSQEVESNTNLASICFNTQKDIFIKSFSEEYKNYINEIPEPVVGKIMQSVIYIPVFSKERVTGVLTVQSPVKEAYTDYHFNLLKNIAISVSTAIENAGLYQNLEAKVAQRTRELESQKNELEKLSLVARNVTNGVVITDAWDLIEWANDSFLNLMGYTLGEIVGKRPIDKFSGSGTEETLKEQILINNYHNSFEILQYTKHGKAIWFLVNITEVRNESGQVIKKIHVVTDITANKKLNERFNHILNNADDLIYTCDKDGKFDFMNASAERVTGFKPDEFIGKHFSFIVHPEERKRVQLFYYKQMTEKTPKTYFEFRLLGRDDQTIHVSQIVNLIMDEAGNLNGFQSIVRDISFIKRIEEEKNKARGEQIRFSKLLTGLSLTPIEFYGNKITYYDHVCKLIAGAMAIERVSFWRYDEQAIICKGICEVPDKNTFIGKRFLRNEHPVYFEALTKELVLSVPDALNAPVLAELKEGYLEKYAIVSLLDVPIWDDGELQGVICCESVNEKRVWTDTEISFLKSVADVSALNLETFRRREVEARIKESENNFRLLNETIDDVFWLMDVIHKRVIYISPSCEKVLGPTAKEFYETDNYWQNYVLDEDKPLILKAHLQIETEGFYEIEYRIRKDGQIKWIHEKSFGIRNENNVLDRSSGICSDVTVQKQTQEALTYSENTFRLMNESLTDVFYLYDIVGKKYDYMSPICKDVLGVDQSFFYNGGSYNSSYVYEEDLNMVENARQHVDNGGQYVIEYRIKSGEGMRWIREKSTPIRNNKGEVVKNSGIITDVTEQKINEEKIRQLSLVAEKTSNGILISGEDGKVIWANQSFLNIFEIPSEKLIGEYPRRLFLSDKKELRERIEQYNEQGKPYAIEFQANTYQNRKIWVELSATYITDHSGKIIQVEVVNDITERRLTEEKIKQLSLVAEKTSNGITIADKDGKILWANQSYLEMFEIPLDKLLGQYPKYLFSGTDANLHKRIEELNSANKGYTLEIHAKTYLKKPIWIELVTTPITDNNGEILQVEIINNITQRKQTEMQIRQLSLVAEKTGNGVLIADHEGVALWANQSYLRMFEIPIEELVGKHPGELFHSGEENLQQKGRQSNGMGYSREMEVVTFLKRPFWVELNNTPIYDENGQLIQQVALVTDITERKLREQIIENQNFDILSSINYAKRIQTALLPTNQFLRALPVDIELYYKPKDIIGGDFYWADQIGKKVVLVVGDCTGHGVPGALMTSLGINGLINSVTEQKQTKPELILNYLGNYLQSIFNADEDENVLLDGMDIAIVCVNTETNSLAFAGAGRSLYFVENGELHRLKGTRQGIGSAHITESYETFVLNNVNERVFYMFSDGMVDQFGGEKNKRVGMKTLGDLLVKIAPLPLPDQKKEISDFYENWMKDHKQTDDMIWMVIKI